MRYMDTTTLRPDQVLPPHEIRDEDKLSALVASMRRTGWTGRPLLVVAEGGDYFQAWTGSHRIAAANALGIAVPCVVMETVSAEDHADSGPVTDDDDRLALLRSLGREQEAALMAAEVEANG